MKGFIQNKEKIIIIAGLMIFTISMMYLDIVGYGLIMLLNLIYIIASMYIYNHKTIKEIGIKNPKTYIFTMMYLPWLIGGSILLLNKKIFGSEMPDMKNTEEFINMIYKAIQEQGSYVHLLEGLLLAFILSFVISFIMQIYVIYKDVKIFDKWED